MKKTKQQQRYVGMRIVPDDTDADDLVQEFMHSDTPRKFYTRPSELTTAFKNADKKGKTKKQTENETMEPNSDDYYSESGENDVFDMTDYLTEMERLSVDDPLQSRGCNHNAMTCPHECRLYHDTERPARRHYHNGEDGTTDFEKSRYGRFVCDPGTINMVRLADDGEEEAFHSIDSQYEHGWHHEPTCSSACVRYHHPGLPERYVKLNAGIFREASDGPWMREWVNGEMAYIRIGPNDVVAGTTRKLPVAPSKPRILPFVEMSQDQVITALRGTLGAEQDMAIREIAQLIGPLQRPIDDGPTIVSILAAGGAGDVEKRGVYEAMCRLFRTHECHTIINYPLVHGEKSDAEMKALVSKSMLEMRAKQHAVSLALDDQCLILLLNLGDISTHESIEALDRLDTLLHDEDRLPLAEDVAVVLYATSHYGASLLNVESHATMASAREAIDDDIGLGCSPTSAHVIPFFRAKPAAETLVRSLVSEYSKEEYIIHGVCSLIADRELEKLIGYIVKRSLAFDSTERGIRQLVCHAIDSTIESATLYMKTLKEEYVQLTVTTAPIITFCLIEKPTETLYPCVAKLRHKPAYKSLVQECINNEWDMPCMVLTWDAYLLRHIHVIEPIEKSVTAAATTTKRRREDEKKEETMTTKKMKKTTTKQEPRIVKHEWIVDEETSNRKTTIYSCQCTLSTKKHYRRQCSSGGDDLCHGDGFKGGMTRGYCAECLKHRK